MMMNRLLKSIVVITLFGTSCVHAVDYDAEDLGKLFTDRGQRAQIDAARSGGRPGTSAKKTSKVTVRGYMSRSDGKSVVWVNENNTLDSSRLGDVRVHGSAIGKNKKVTVSVDGKQKRLRPGETWNKQTGKVVEDY